MRKTLLFMILGMCTMYMREAASVLNTDSEWQAEAEESFKQAVNEAKKKAVISQACKDLINLFNEGLLDSDKIMEEEIRDSSVNLIRLIEIYHDHGPYKDNHLIPRSYGTARDSSIKVFRKIAKHLQKLFNPFDPTAPNNIDKIINCIENIIAEKRSRKVYIDDIVRHPIISVLLYCVFTSEQYKPSLNAKKSPLDARLYKTFRWHYYSLFKANQEKRPLSASLEIIRAKHKILQTVKIDYFRTECAILNILDNLQLDSCWPTLNQTGRAQGIANEVSTKLKEISQTPTGEAVLKTALDYIDTIYQTLCFDNTYDYISRVLSFINDPIISAFLTYMETTYSLKISYSWSHRDYLWRKELGAQVKARMSKTGAQMKAGASKAIAYFTPSRLTKVTEVTEEQRAYPSPDAASTSASLQLDIHSLSI